MSSKATAFGSRSPKPTRVDSGPKQPPPLRLPPSPNFFSGRYGFLKCRACWAHGSERESMPEPALGPGQDSIQARAGTGPARGRFHGVARV